MLRTSSLFNLSILSFLAACSAPGLNGLNGGSSSPILATPAPELPETVESGPTGSGMTGFAIGSGGGMVTVTVRLSEDGWTAWVSVDGGEETEFTGAGSSSSGEWSDGSILLLIDEGKRGADFQMGEELQGAIGTLTDVDSLPGDLAWYNGTWSLETVGEKGAMHMSIDFSNNGSIGGNITGAYQGDIEGEANGSMIEGLIQIDPQQASGTLVFMGGIFGDNGELVQGLLSGELTTEDGSNMRSGSFELGRTGR